MTVPNGFQGLRFPCECVSANQSGYSEPWAVIARNRLLPNGTKEQILNLLALEPKTISQLAEILKLSAPSVHTHINDMVKSQLLRESVDWKKKFPAERYYEPNFPVMKDSECGELRQLCDELSEYVVKGFAENSSRLEEAFEATSLSKRGWDFSDISQALYARIYRMARTKLEKQGLLNQPIMKANGVEWIFWAEQPESDGKSEGPVFNRE